MTLCKVLLFGLKPCDISSSTNDKISEISNQRQHSLIPTISPKFTQENSSSSNTDYLNLDIKPLATPTSSVGKLLKLIFLKSNTFVIAFFNKQ